MNKKKVIASSLGAFLILPSLSQNIVNYSQIRTEKEQVLLLNDIYSSKAHYKNAPYNLTLDYLPSAHQLYDRAEGYYRVGHRLAENTLDYFIKEYPTDSRKSITTLHRSALYMHKGDFNRARYYLEKLDETALSALEKTEWQVRLAYALLKTNRKEGNIADLFAQASSTDNHWGRVASFYVGSELIAQGNLKEAQRIYQTLLSYPDLEAEARIGLAAIDYFNGNYEQTVATIASVERKAPQMAFHSSLLQIAGNAFYRLGDAPNTIRYFERLVSLNPGHLSSEDWLLLGAAYIENGDLESSISPLLKASVGKDFASEVANLYLGRARRDLGRYTESVTSYELASAQGVTPSIREAAMYEMALVMRSSGQSNFGQDVRIAEQFLALFPKSQHVKTMERFLTEFYLSNSNYTTSLASIERVKSSSTAIREARQYVLNHLSLETLKKGDIAEAKRLVQRAQDDPISKLYKSESLLIEAEIAFAEGRYDAAVPPLKELAQSYVQYQPTNRHEVQYRLGYAFFNSARLDEAAQHFNSYLKSDDKDPLRKSDASARWADCRYAKNALDDALSGYQQAVQLAPQQSSYALFRSAEIYGLRKNYARQIETLDRLVQLFPDNAVVSKALLEKGRALLFSGNTSGAEKTLGLAFKQFGNSEAGRSAQLQLALLYYNTQRPDSALEAYATLMQKYPRSAEASTAFSNLKSMCIEMGRMDYIDRVISSTKGAFSLSDNETRELQFQTAEGEYRRNPERAQRALEEFVSRYHNGADVLKAQKYLADIAYQKGDEEKAYSLYSQVAQAQKELSESLLISSLNRLGLLQKKRAEYNNAHRTYIKMYEIATEQSMRLTAAEEATHMALLGGMYKEGADLSTHALKTFSGESTEKLRLYRAHCYNALNKEEVAREEYKNLSKNTDKEVGAEALVSYAKMLSKSATQRKEAKKLLNQFIEKGTPHEYWLASGIILLSDIYRLDGDAITANQYLESLRSNYPNQKDNIHEEVNKRLSTSTHDN
ncbi:tetratricopeptide repeat protein [Porphyromonas circumdentaria]|uniref:Tetratricopeptide repeat-containing protein n=1 Tax=Porphyromonas circumdentaria TaxID=29524 RepID=A0A1T4P191_9PORP|nr:tetratricopeptide repeat protein [Porphyromonas circumdentaria]MBB6276274.1 tetratricopeptide (TPR) repeat protein [Porphyromonas circumdentaria]SJZ85380.1 Tetratricopeptide repeat-containing protein [Porphyromonas circumdentaria]